MELNKMQLEILKKVGVEFQISIPLSDDQLIEIEKKVADYLVRYCLDENYDVNEEGEVCESILDMLDMLGMPD